MRRKEDETWFGPTPALGDMAPADAARAIREAGDETLADELDASVGAAPQGVFGMGDGLLGGLLNRVVRTANVCGVLPTGGNASDVIVPVSQVEPDSALRDKRLKITLDGLHVAKYPGRGRHNLLFDFAVQSQIGGEDVDVFHYNAKFGANDGETVPVRNFPLFYGLQPSAEGIVFGFQIINVSSELDEGLLAFLDGGGFKKGLALATASVPVLSQISAMVVGLTKWLAGQSKNTKVQEFHQGLDFATGGLGGGLVQGTYVVAQIPLEHERDWDWSEWRIDPTLLRLVHRDDPEVSLDFNHLMFGVREMAPVDMPTSGVAAAPL